MFLWYIGFVYEVIKNNFKRFVIEFVYEVVLVLGDSIYKKFKVLINYFIYW